MNYTVGQIVYLLSKKEIKVYPAQIIEEIKRKTINEEIVSYIILLPDKGKTEVLIEELSAKKKIPQVDENKVEIDLGNGLKASMDTSQINQINI